MPNLLRQSSIQKSFDYLKKAYYDAKNMVRELNKRTHHCGALRKSDQGQSVLLIGWIQHIRDHGGLCFIDLRDREGITQLVLNPQPLSSVIDQLKPESVIEAHGTVALRPQETINKNLPTGEIEVNVSEVIIHNICQTLPFPLDEKAQNVSEDTRLTYRYLDLRRSVNQKRLRLRHRAAHVIRNYLDQNGFLEVELPVLFKSTPEGAREFLVPSRLNPGQCYALTQSPQQYKQMLMVAGIERYFSFAKCFRDEDLRADRQPEFTQIDLEASFIDREDIYPLMEGLIHTLWKNCLDVDIPIPFPRLSFQEVMNRYGSDKPDRRFGLEIQDVSELFKNSNFNVFAKTVQNGGVIKALKVENFADMTAGELKELEESAKQMGAKGLAFIKVTQQEWKSPIVKFLSDDEKQGLTQTLQLHDNDCVFFMADKWEQACTVLGKIRLEISKILVKRGSLSISDTDYQFLWVVDFPLLTYDPEQAKFVATHHPFTAPVKEDIPLLKTDPYKVRGQHYDLVLNGIELGGGSIRIHNPELQRFIFEQIIKIPADKVQDRFGYMLKAFSFGAPPHGGIALGFDRLVALMSGTHSIRDVIAFPKTQKGQDLMSNSPSTVDAQQLRTLGLKALPTT